MGMNKVTLLGNLGRDPELRYTTARLPICTFSIATGAKDSGADPEAKQNETEWHQIVTFGPLAESCNRYLIKGKQALIEGSIKTRKWTDKEGKERKAYEILAREVHFVGPKETIPADISPAIPSIPDPMTEEDIPF